MRATNKVSFIVALAFVFSFSTSVWAADIAVCGSSKGYSYDAYRNLTGEKDSGWSEDAINEGKFSLVRHDNGDLDLLVAGALGLSSVKADGATVIPVSISETAVSIIVFYPNRLTETYVFQKLKSGKFQAMWTQAKAETPFPRVTAFVSDCSSLNLSPLIEVK